MSTCRRTVLLVEDDSNDILLIRRAFDKADLPATLRVTEDGEQAVAYLSGDGEFADRDEHPLPVLILLDLKLPRMSGFEVLEWLGNQRELSMLPVVVLTSSGGENDINRAYRLGANSYVVKPVGFSNLVDLVRTVHAYWFVLNRRPDLDGDGFGPSSA